MTGISNCPAVKLCSEARRIAVGRAAGEIASAASSSKCLRGGKVQEHFPFFARKEFEEAQYRLKKDLRVAILQISSCEKIGADHF
jgi:hypothetical protein